MNAHNCGMGPVAMFAPALYGIVDHPTLYGVTLGALPTREPPGPPQPAQPRVPPPLPYPLHFPQPVGAHPAPAPAPVGTPAPASQSGYSTGAVILGVLGVAAAIALGVYAYRSWRAPAPTYPERR